MNQVFLVWETVGETTDCYYFPEVPNDIYKAMLAAHNNYGGLVAETPEQKLAEAAVAAVWEWFKGLGEPVQAQHKVESAFKMDKPPVTVIVTGWVL